MTHLDFSKSLLDRGLTVSLKKSGDYTYASCKTKIGVLRWASQSDSDEIYPAIYEVNILEILNSKE